MVGATLAPGGTKQAAGAPGRRAGVNVPRALIVSRLLPSVALFETRVSPPLACKIRAARERIPVEPPEAMSVTRA